MLYNINSLSNAAIFATDGEIGKVKQFYFDDEKWVVRYIVASVGPLLHRKNVLISPISVKKIHWDDSNIELTLNCKQVLNSPDVDTDMPISRQHEIEFHKYFGWTTYWGLPDLWAAGSYPIAVPLPEEDHTLGLSDTIHKNTHLRSSREVMGYRIHTKDGEFGHLQDLVVDEMTWAVTYLVINTKNWWLGRLALLASSLVTKVSWDDQQIYTDLSADFIKNSPEYISGSLITRHFEQKLRDYYKVNKTKTEPSPRRA